MARPRILREGGQGTGFDLKGCNLSAVLIAHANPTELLHPATASYVLVKLSNLIANDFKSGYIPVSALPAFSGDLSSAEGHNTLTLNVTGVSAGVYTKVRVDHKGRITNGYELTEADLPNISFTKITSGKPTTIAGYGITDAVGVVGGVVTGNLKAGTETSANNDAVTKEYADVLLATAGDSILTGHYLRKITSEARDGFLRCNGGQVLKTDYPALYAEVGDQYNILHYPGFGRLANQHGLLADTTGSITAWSTVTGVAPLQTSMYGSYPVVTSSRLYLLGGNDGSNAYNTIAYAKLNDDGSLGNFVTDTSVLPAVGMGVVFTYRNRVYAIAGAVAGNPSRDRKVVRYATIDDDGVIGGWTELADLPFSQQGLTIVLGNKIYMLGGWTGASTYTQSVRVGTINEDGTIGNWVISGTVPGALYGQGLIITKSRVYMIGGADIGGVYYNLVQVAPINADGTLGAWSTTTNFPITAYAMTTYVSKNRVWVFGIQQNPSTNTAAVYTAPINADGTLGTWATTTSLPAAKSHAQGFGYKGKIYLLGGSTTNGVTNSYNVASVQGAGDFDFSQVTDEFNYPTASDKFRLPDMTTKELDGSFTFIKT